MATSALRPDGDTTGARAWLRRVTRTSAVLVLLLVASAEAQESPPGAPAFVETVQVRVIEVEVVVTDGKGNPVLGLSQEDFRIFEDGEEMELTNFYAVEAGRRLPEPAPEGDSEVVTPPAGKTYLVLVVDSVHLAPGARTRVVRQLQDQLDVLAEHTAGVMVVNLGHAMKVENRFTQDVTLIEDSLDRILRSGQGIGSNMRRNSILRDIENGVDPRAAQGADAQTAQLIMMNAEADARQTFGDIHTYATESRIDLENGHRRLRTLIASLAGLEGRKAVLYVSSGYETRLGEGLFQRWWDKYQFIGNRLGVHNIQGEINLNDVTHQIQSLVAHASANGAVFYALGPGIERFAPMSAEIRTAASSSALQGLVGNEVGVLEALAVGTGGLSLTTSNNVDYLITAMARGFESYYSLGYSSEQEGSGKRRKIRVEVDDPDLKVRHPRGYLDKTGEDLMKERTLAALLLDVSENPLDIGVEIGDEKRRNEDGTFLLPIQVKVPIANLTLLPEADHHVARLSLVFVAQDERGTSDPVYLEVPISIPNAQLLSALSQSAAYSAELAVREGEQKLAIGVRDEIAELDSTLNVVANVGKVASGSL